MNPAIPVPSGTVTFVFTDIEGSTRRWESNPGGMQSALRRHDALLRDMLARHGGLVFKAIGDAFCAAFERPADAVAAALAAQRAFLHEDFTAVGGLRVRVAVHTGTADERDGDYFGPTVNRVARLLAVGHGGQVLLSGAAAELVRDALPRGAGLRDLGEHRLRDLLHAMHVYQIVASGLEENFPPLRSLASHPNNLPLELTSFIGRTGDIAEVAALLGEHRIVTVVGAGGIGKTRTALHVAAQLVDGNADGTWFVDLAPLTEGSLIASSIARAMNVKVIEGDSLASLAGELRSLHALVVLDNCEHVVEAAAHVVSSLVHQCPRLSILATSRQALGIAGEAAYPLPSLPLPASVELFVARAAAVNPHFSLAGDEPTIVADICIRLDGIPLAIELAAARTKMLAPQKLRSMLEERFRVLSGGNRDALPRHQTMRATIDWSYNLLTEVERSLLRRVSVFAGGWVLEAAETVCGDEPLHPSDILDLQFSLIEKSLVTTEMGSGETRYRLLESTRSYALEKLAEANEREAFARRHAQWIAEFAQQAYDRTWSMPLAKWTPPVEAEFDNVRAALSWSLNESADPVLGGAIAGALITFWYRRPAAGLEGRRWVEAALGSIDEAAHVRIAARLYFTQALLSEGSQSLEAARRALVLYQRLGDSFHIAFSYRQLAVSYLQALQAPQALDAIDRSVYAFEEAGTTKFWPYATALAVRAAVLTALGRDEEARSMFARAIALFEANGDEQRAAFHRVNWGKLEYADGNFRLALELLGQGLKVIRDGPYFGQESWARANAASCHLMLGELDAAESEATMALKLAKRAELPSAITASLQHLATAAALRGEIERAVRLCGYCDEWYRVAGIASDPLQSKPYDLLKSALAKSSSESELAKLLATGATLTEEQAAAEALAAHQPAAV